ncbi:MAG: Lrp/AsnC ligand binding domain-containing protein [Candidatus Odinarchaeota archaeon]|nr:Lrp/AsnC ligand binding domain-containing protein [Candidatus Odinarchaeota archaeon]
MPTAFVLIKTKAGLEEKALRKILEIEGVKEAYIVLGTYDIVAKLSVENLENLQEIVSQKIRRSIEEIEETMTMLVIQGASK